MQDVSELYTELVAEKGCRFECRLVIAGQIIIDETKLIQMRTVRNLFAGTAPTIGSCVSGEITVSFLDPGESIPRMAKLEPQVRAVSGGRCSEWIRKGVFYIDTREKDQNGIISIHGYDDMLKTEVDFPYGLISEWPSVDSTVVQAAASHIGVQIDERTWDIMDKDYVIQLPSEYTSREVLGYIGSMYAGCWIMNDLGLLQLITLNGLPEETNYLTDESGNLLSFGGTRILI